MKNNGLHNYPDERRRVTYSTVTWDGAFSDEELAKIVDYCESRPPDDGKLIDRGDERLTKSVRKSDIRFVRYDQKNADVRWIFERLNFVISSINDRFYGFDLNGYNIFQYTTYSVSGHYDWHVDLCHDLERLPDEMQEPRKLSLSLLLNNEFTGGEFQFSVGCEANPVTLATPRGRSVVFPSWIPHRICPILSGVRKSLVVWVVGPKFT